LENYCRFTRFAPNGFISQKLSPAFTFLTRAAAPLCVNVRTEQRKNDQIYVGMIILLLLLLLPLRGEK
jgi:hypothetical protein